MLSYIWLGIAALLVAVDQLVKVLGRAFPEPGGHHAR